MKKRYSDKWQLLGGFTWGRHEGFDYSDSYMQYSDFNNPNFLLNRDNGSVWFDLPWTFKMSGSYMFPHDIQLGGKWEGRAGRPLTRTLPVTGLNQGTETVYVAQRGEDRTESLNAFIDISISKSFSVGRSRIEPAFQIFNLLNSATVLNQRSGIGASWGRATQYLAPRVIRLGIKWIF